MTRVSLTVLFALGGFLLIANPGCVKCGEKLTETVMEKAVEQATGGKTGIDIGSDIDLSGLPDYLRYPGAKATGKFAISTGEGSGASYTFETTAAKADVVNWFKTSLGSQSWKETFVMESGDATSLSYVSGDEKSTTVVTVTASDGKTTIGIILGSNSK
jgi:hypothetical protein